MHHVNMPIAPTTLVATFDLILRASVVDGSPLEAPIAERRQQSLRRNRHARTLFGISGFELSEDSSGTVERLVNERRATKKHLADLQATLARITTTSAVSSASTPYAAVTSDNSRGHSSDDRPYRRTDRDTCRPLAETQRVAVGVAEVNV